MLLADSAASATTAATAAAPAAVGKNTFHLFGWTIDVFDLFVLAFTVLIIIAVIRSIKAETKNKFAIGFGIIALIVFIYMDFIMVTNWIHPPNA